MLARLCSVCYLGGGVDTSGDAWFMKCRTIAVDIAKGDVLKHCFGYPSCQCSNLGVDVGEEGVRGPPTMFFDDDIVHAVEFHCHGPTSSQGVATYSLFSEAKLMQSEVEYGLFESFADMGWVYLGGLLCHRVVVGADGCVLIVGKGHDVGNSAG